MTALVTASQKSSLVLGGDAGPEEGLTDPGGEGERAGQTGEQLETHTPPRVTEEGVAARSSVLAWRAPCAEEPGGPPTTGSQESDTT